MCSLHRGRSRQCGPRHPSSQRLASVPLGPRRAFRRRQNWPSSCSWSSTLMVSSDYWEQSPLGFPLGGASVAYSLVRSQHSLRRNKELVRSFSALDKELLCLIEKISLNKPIKASNCLSQSQNPQGYKACVRQHLNVEGSTLHLDTADLLKMNQKAMSLNSHHGD